MANVEVALSAESSRDGLSAAEAFLNRRFPRRRITRVLLVNPPDADATLFRYEAAKRGRYANFPPYGLAVLARHLRSLGAEVRITNLNHEVLKRCHEVTTEDELAFATTWQQRLDHDLAEFAPDLVGVTCMFTMTHASFRDVCARVAASGVPIAIGGVHVTNDVDRVLDDLPFVDFAFLREGDLAIKRFVEAVNRRATLESLGQVIFNDDAGRHVFSGDCLPSAEDISIIPAFDLADVTECSQYGTVGSYYWFKGPTTRAATALSNRGCRARCTFCSVRNFNGPGVRQRSIASVVDELEVLEHEYGIDHIMWLDDDLLRDHSRAVALFNEMVRRRMRLTWDATNSVIAASCTDEVIAAAEASGCIAMHIGMESGNPEILKRIRKPGTVEAFLRAASVFRRYERIYTCVYLIVGFPGETMSMISDTLRVAREMDLDWYRIFQLQPLPNTPIYDEMVAQGLIKPADRSETRYIIGAYGKASQVEKDRRFLNDSLAAAFQAIAPDAIPTSEQLTDIWFYMDYHLNYHRLLHEDRPTKIAQQLRMLARIFDTIVPDNAFALYFAERLQDRRDGQPDPQIGTRLRRQLAESPYWASRFRVTVEPSGAR